MHKNCDHVAGFSEVRVERLAHDFQNSDFIATKAPITSAVRPVPSAKREAEPLPQDATI